MPPARFVPMSETGQPAGDVPAIQDTYPEDVAHCYGCGRLNDVGHQIKTRAAGDETATTFMPKPFHTAIPGYAYGGLVASIIDCHSTGSAAIFQMRHAGKTVGSEFSPRFVTAHLEVDYLLPTPLSEFHLVGRLVEIKGRKVVVEEELFADGVLCARGQVVAVRMPEGMLPRPANTD